MYAKLKTQLLSAMGNQTNYRGQLGPIGPCEKAFLDDVYYNMHVLFESLECCFVEDKHVEYKDFTVPGGIIGYKTEVRKTPDVETSEWIIDYDYNDPYKNPNQKYILGSRTVWIPGQIETVEVPQYGPYVVEKRPVTTYYQCSKCKVRSKDEVLQESCRGAYFDSEVGVVRLPYQQEPCSHKGKVDRLVDCQAAWYATWCADHPHKSLKPDQIRIFFKVLQGGGKPASRPKYTSQEALQALTRKSFPASKVLCNLSLEAKTSLPVMMIFAHFHPELHDLLPAWTRTDATIQRAKQQQV